MFFANRVIDIWKFSPESVVHSLNVSIFEHRLEKCKLKQFFFAIFMLFLSVPVYLF